jgi:hypothetical protein
MFEILLKYVLSSLVQQKGKDISWINWINGGIESAISGANFTKKQLRFWKHLLTASREGDDKVRAMHYLNMTLKVLVTGAHIAIWFVLSKWFFQEFNPFSYLDINGDFWEAIIVIGLPLMSYAFLSGQLDWFGSNDAYEDGTLTAESLPFKWLVSISAGVTEELSHRGALIFIGLISVYFGNLFFPWIILVLLLALCLFLLAKFEFQISISVLIFSITLVTLLSLKKYAPENPIYLLNEYIFHFLQWITSSNILLAGFIATLMSLSLAFTVVVLQKKNDFSMHPAEFVSRILLFTIWSVYCLPMSIQAIATMPILPQNGNHWTYLLYIGAILWSNAKFRDGHKYQGPAGMLNSYVVGMYMFYITFTHGLLYAIVLHVMFDAVLFTSEHVCQIIKNRKLVLAS